MFLISPTTNDRFVAQIRMANGRLAGEGYGRSQRTAMFLACLDAVHNGYTQIAIEHAQALSIRDENAVRIAAQQPQMENPVDIYIRPKRVSPVELAEMKKILSQCGYNPAYAAILQREGMTPRDLKGRLSFVPGEPGSLEYTHGFVKNPINWRNPLSMRGKEAVLGVSLLAGIVGVAIILRSKSAAAAGSSLGPITINLTGTNAGPVSMNVGDSLNVQLPLGNGIANYVSSASSAVPTPLTEGTQVTQGGQYVDTWTASSAGKQTLTYQGVDASNVAVGSPIVFAVTVS